MPSGTLEALVRSRITSMRAAADDGEDVDGRVVGDYFLTRLWRAAPSTATRAAARA